MGKYFSITELIKSNTAEKLGISNVPNEEEVNNLNLLINHVLDPIRTLWGKPISVNSGFRCDKLNKAVSGVSTSQHRFGQAADLTTNSLETNKELFEMIKKSNIPYDQLIDEYNYKWIHVSFSSRNRRQVLYIK